MGEHVIAVASVVGAWWLSTGVLLVLHARVERARGATAALIGGLVGATALGSVGGVVWLSAQPTAAGAYAASLCALVVWASHELSFLTGLVTGPRKTPCPPGLRGLERFRAATSTLIHHELLLAGTLLALVVLTWRAPNQAGTATFGVLWWMRVSAKLNLFVGVPNANTELMPTRLRYLVTYFGPARLSPWLPVSLVGAVGLGAVMLPAMSATPVASTLVGTLLTLGAVEHLFLARPFGDAALWRWATPAALPAHSEDLRGPG